jgi:hypothetical protein
MYGKKPAVQEFMPKAGSGHLIDFHGEVVDNVSGGGIEIFHVDGDEMAEATGSLSATAMAFSEATIEGRPTSSFTGHPRDNINDHKQG